VRPKRTPAVVFTAVAGVVVGVLIFAAILSLSGSGKAKSKLAPNVFKVGKAKNQAVIVDRHGPLLFPDPLQKGRDIYVNHLGDNQWAAFEVHPPSEPKTCTVKWDPPSRTFRDPCSGRAYPADGTGLTRYKAYVDKSGDLIVDLHQPIS
jgi:hypothetical protein